MCVEYFWMLYIQSWHLYGVLLEVQLFFPGANEISDVLSNSNAKAGSKWQVTVVLGFYLSHSTHMPSYSCPHSSPHFSFSGITFLSMAQEGAIVNSSEVLYTPYRMHRSVNVALCEFSYKLNGLRGGLFGKYKGFYLCHLVLFLVWISALNH